MSSEQRVLDERLTTLVYRDYRPGDEEQIARLMSKHWKHIQNASDWLHEFVHSPDGSCVSRVCQVHDQIVGHYGLILMGMTLAGQKVLGGKGEGSVVHPEFRKTSPRLKDLPFEHRSIFERLSGDVWREGTAKGVGVMWGFPNGNALHGHLRAGWEPFILRTRKLIRPVSAIGTAHLLSTRIPHAYRLPNFTRLLIALPLWFFIKCSRPLKCSENLEVVSVKEFDERIDNFWQRLVLQFPMISINRTYRHLNWRFAHEPYVRVVCLSEGQVVGFAIGLLKDERGVVEFQLIDLVIDDMAFPFIPHVLSGLLEAVGFRKIDFMSTQSFEGCWYQRRLNSELKKYFWLGLPMETVTAILKVDPSLASENYLRNSGNWFINTLFYELF